QIHHIELQAIHQSVGDNSKGLPGGDVVQQQQQQQQQQNLYTDDPQQKPLRIKMKTYRVHSDSSAPARNYNNNNTMETLVGKHGTKVTYIPNIQFEGSNNKGM